MKKLFKLLALPLSISIIPALVITPALGAINPSVVANNGGGWQGGGQGNWKGHGDNWQGKGDNWKGKGNWKHDGWNKHGDGGWKHKKHCRYFTKYVYFCKGAKCYWNHGEKYCHKKKCGWYPVTTYRCWN